MQVHHARMEPPLLLFPQRSIYCSWGRNWRLSRRNILRTLRTRLLAFSCIFISCAISYHCSLLDVNYKLVRELQKQTKIANFIQKTSTFTDTNKTVSKRFKHKIVRLLLEILQFHSSFYYKTFTNCNNKMCLVILNTVSKHILLIPNYIGISFI